MARAVPSSSATIRASSARRSSALANHSSVSIAVGSVNVGATIRDRIAPGAGRQFGEDRPPFRLRGGEVARAKRHIAFQREQLERGQQRQRGGGVAMRRGDFRLHRFAPKHVDQRVGGGVVADGDHHRGERVQRHGRTGGPVLHPPAGERADVQRHHLAPPMLPGLDCAGQRGQHVELEGRADREASPGVHRQHRFAVSIGHRGRPPRRAASPGRRGSCRGCRRAAGSR